LNNIVPTITGANPSDFAISTGAGACGATLAAGSSCSIYVTFTPASATSFSATLSVADSATGSPQTSTLTGTGTTVVSGAWPNGYNYQATFTVAAGKVPSAQTNFPALISGTFADFATTGNGGKIANTCNQTVGNNVTSVPCDLIFTSDAAGTQLVSWEYETYSATNGAVNVWVNVPNLANGTTVYAWYGQPSVTTLQSTPSATWSNYMAVYHMKENPTGGAPQLNDSTSNGNNATFQGPAAAGQQEPGEIDGSIAFTNNTWANLSNTSAFDFERTDSFSLSGWIKIGSNTNGQILTKEAAGAENSGWLLFQNPVGASPAIEFGLIGTGASTLALARTPSISMGTWHYVVATYSGTSTTAGMTIYVDGVPQTLTTIANNLSTTIVNNLAPAINSRATGYLESSDGMDELRVSAKGVVLTPAFVTASYNNESNPGTFFGVTTGLTNQTTGPVASLSSSVTFPNTTSGTTSAALAATLSNTGNASLNNIVPSITGANPSDFAISTGAGACGATLAAGSSCSIWVTFTPASAISFSATLSVADSATGSPQTSTLTGTGTPAAPTTWPNGYNYQATFTVAAGKVPSAQTNFPALISGTFADFATTGNGGKVANTCNQTVGNNVTSVPCDLIFTSDAAGTQLLSWEYETYSATNGAVNVWVNVPNLANGTTVYAWYGQPSVTTLQSTPSATWSNYMAVYHMKENPTGGAPQLNDSTSNGNNATMQGSPVASQQQPGVIDGSIGFTYSTWANLSSTSAFSFERTDSFSLSGWIKIGSNTNGQILTKQSAAESSGWMLFQNPVGASPAIEFGLVGTGASTLALARTPSISMGTWHYVVATYSGTSTTAGMTIYVDGVAQTLTSIANNLSTTIVNNVAPAISSRATGFLESNDGMDELRVSTKGVVLTPAWVTASYNNESSPATFFTVNTGLTNP
jgi:cytochrome c556